ARGRPPSPRPRARALSRRTSRARPARRRTATPRSPAAAARSRARAPSRSRPARASSPRTRRWPAQTSTAETRRDAPEPSPERATKRPGGERHPSGSLPMSTKATFTRYQIFVVALLAFLQFTVVLDFMILSPLGAMLLGELGIKPAQFGRVVSAYALSAGVSGLAAAGFADRFDRRKFLLVFYVGFVIGTFLCGIA